MMLDKFRFKIVSLKEYSKLENDAIKRAVLFNGMRELEQENEKLKEELSKTSYELRQSLVGVERQLIDVKMGDPSPFDTEDRIVYVAKVAGLHKDILEPKLKQMISKAHELLEDETNDHAKDQSLKGVVYALWEMIRWGEMMLNEHISYLQNQNPAKAEEKINN